MNIFDSIQVRKPKKNKFNLSHEKKLTMNMGNLVPIMCQEILPGDRFKVNTELMIRMNPLTAPIYQRVKAYTHYFFVPNRLVWDEFKDFITGGVTGTAAPAPPRFLTDQVTKTYLTESSLADYMGIPTIAPGATVINFQYVSALPFRAYQLIYNEYFRDQTLTPEVTIVKTSGTMASAGTDLQQILTMRKRSWQKDYFTSCLPQAQRGGSVIMPITGNAAVTYKPTTDIWPASAPAGGPGGFTTGGPISVIPNNTNNPGWIRTDGTSVPASQPLRIENIASVSMTGATTTINDLRTAARLQEWLEKNARGGARYIEQILHHFGVRSSDARLQRPEFLGGHNVPIVISEVLSNFEDATSDPQGTMAGHGIAVSGRHGFNRTFEEHGYVIGLLSVLPLTNYQQGIPRHFSRATKLDYAWPEFAQLGEQAVLDKELYYNPLIADTDPNGGNGTFGYQSRYAEYKYNPSTSHGAFRSTLAYWGQTRIFPSKPSLNAAFVEADPSDRIFAVQGSTDKLLVNLYHSVDAIRALPYFNDPRL
jgi:hypothetical protein